MKEIFSLVVKKVEQAHEQYGSAHHDFVHARRVGNNAYWICMAEWKDRRSAVLARLAGICHNADKLIQVRDNLKRMKPSTLVVEALIKEWFTHEGKLLLSPADMQVILDAVVHHGGVNTEHDSRVLIALRDADRIVNLSPDIWMRSALHFSDKPIINYENPIDRSAPYDNPPAILDDVLSGLDWVTRGSVVFMRTKAGLSRAKKRARRLQTSVLHLIRDLNEDGIL